MVEKVQGFGGVVLPHAPSLVVAVFGVPLMLEQAPQRAVQAALTLRRLVAEAAEAGPSPELRLAVHWGQVLVDTGAERSPGTPPSRRRHAGTAGAAPGVCRAGGNLGLPRDGPASRGLVRTARA
jgi:hypothetical protein